MEYISSCNFTQVNKQFLDFVYTLWIYIIFFSWLLIVCYYWITRGECPDLQGNPRYGFKLRKPGFGHMYHIILLNLPLTSISTEWVCRVGVMQVKVPESSLLAWKMLRRYSSWESLPGSLLHPSGYFLSHMVLFNIAGNDSLPLIKLF